MWVLSNETSTGAPGLIFSAKARGAWAIHASARYARADQEQSLHRFPEARADIEKAKSLGATGEDVAGVVQELDWNDGKYDAAIAAIRAASTRKSLYTLAREAQLHHDLGEQDAADREFEEAEDLLRDTSPIPLAWINVQ